MGCCQLAHMHRSHCNSAAEKHPKFQKLLVHLLKERTLVLRRPSDGLMDKLSLLRCGRWRWSWRTRGSSALRRWRHARSWSWTWRSWRLASTWPTRTATRPSSSWRNCRLVASWDPWRTRQRWLSTCGVTTACSYLSISLYFSVCTALFLYPSVNLAICLSFCVCVYLCTSLSTPFTHLSIPLFLYIFLSI